jgi:hypothetical protein
MWLKSPEARKPAESRKEKTDVARTVVDLSFLVGKGTGTLFHRGRLNSFLCKPFGGKSPVFASCLDHRAVRFPQALEPVVHQLEARLYQVFGQGIGRLP